MRVNFDHGTDALYLRLDESKVVDSEQVAPGVIVRQQGSGRWVGSVGVVQACREALDTQASKDPQI